MTVQTILPWADLLWIPLAFLVSEKGKRLFTAAFAGACAFLLRLQVELLQQIGFPKGFLGLMESDILHRGMVVYGIFIVIFLILAYFSKGTDKNIHLAAAITIMMTAFCVSSLVMVL